MPRALQAQADSPEGLEEDNLVVNIPEAGNLEVADSRHRQPEDIPAATFRQVYSAAEAA